MIEFTAPPPARRGSFAPDAELVAAADALRARPGEWALIKRATPTVTKARNISLRTAARVRASWHVRGDMPHRRQVRHRQATVRHLCPLHRRRVVTPDPFEPPVCPCGEYATARHICRPDWLLPITAAVLRRKKRAA